MVTDEQIRKSEYAKALNRIKELERDVSTLAKVADLAQAERDKLQTKVEDLETELEDVRFELEQANSFYHVQHPTSLTALMELEERLS